MIILMKAAFYDCPTCDGVDFENTELMGFPSEDEMFSFIKKYPENYKFLKVYNPSLEEIWEIETSTGFHRVREIKFTHLKSKMTRYLRCDKNNWNFFEN